MSSLKAVKLTLMTKKVIIGLDLSTTSSGYSILDLQGNIVEAGNIVPIKYSGHTKDKYPKSTLLKARSIADQITPLVLDAFSRYEVVQLVVEEISLHRSIVTAKALTFVHAFIFMDCIEHLDVLTMLGPGEWRGKNGINVQVKSRTKVKDHKQPIIDFINDRYGISLGYDENDTAEAIAIALAYLYIQKLLTK